MNVMGIQKTLSNLKNSLLIDYLGIADLKPAKEFIESYGGKEISKYPTAISIGIVLPHDIVNGLSNRSKKAHRIAYKTHGYSIVNDRLNYTASLIASFIQQNGFSAYPIAASERVDDEKIAGAFSHKLAAHLSGLGWIGKSCLLITPGNGPRVRWVTVLTDAPLEATGRPVSPECGSCTECVDICPVKAFTGKMFDQSEQRSARYDAKKCDDYFKEMENNNEATVCGLCLYICPYGNNKR